MVKTSRLKKFIRLGRVFAFVCVVFLISSFPHAAETAPSKSAGDAATPEHFKTRIAPLLARHCLECHDSSSQEGDLDLSHKSRAFAGGESGQAIRAGSSGESLIWQYVESDEMPKNRAALSDPEKQLLREWIDAGATWSLDTIDAEAYRNADQGDAVWLQRLTVAEYIETVRSAVGVEIEEEALRLLPRDQRADGFSNTAYNLSIDLSHVEAYARLAKIIVGRMDVVAFGSEFADCKQLDDRCMRAVIGGMGKRLFRGPLREREINSFLAVSTAVKDAGGDFPEAVGFVLQAMLQSPRFIFRLEQQRGDGTPQPVDDYELASRMSYTLWGAPPDEQLLQLAESGKLNDPRQIEAQTERMLRDQRAVDRSLRFVSEWLNLERLESLRPNENRFPQWNPRLAADMRMETSAFFEDLVWKQDRPLWELMNAQFTYATPRLAHHYGLFSQRGTPEAAGESVPRISKGLRALYTFKEGNGAAVRDVSGSEDRLDLKIADVSGVRWQPQGLEIQATTLIASEKPPTALIGSLKKSNAITLEAWITPADPRQSGPARIVTLSNGPNARNFTLGQEKDTFEVRLRTTKSSGNGIPAVRSKSGSALAALVHIVYTRDASGSAKVFVNGQESSRGKIEGNFSNWDDRMHLALGNELSKDRLWQGTLHLVAVYDRALSLGEVRQNHAAGTGSIEADLAAHRVAAAWEQSSHQDLIALYRFNQGQGNVIRNFAETGDSLDLKIESPSSVNWGPAGLTVYDSAFAATEKPPQRLIEAVRESKAFSLEAWVTPANATQDGPARLLTFSSGISRRNFTLGQDGNRFDLRVRASRTDHNGMPSLASQSGSATPRLTHLVFTADRSGQARLYVNGQEQAAQNIGGNLDQWDRNFRLAIANETSRDRPWLGTFHLVAIYSRALDPEEIRNRGGAVARYDLADNPTRGGLLTQGSILTIGGDEASMVTRGLFILHNVLDGRVGNPPAGVDTSPIPTKPGVSMRANAELRLADSACTGCHVKFEPLAFGLEKFNGIGGYLEVDEHGNKLREDGEVRFPGSDLSISYRTSAELMELLAQSDRVRLVITRKLVQFALGRPLNADDLRHVEKIHARAEQQGGTYRAVMTAILTSDLVRMTYTESE